LPEGVYQVKIREEDVLERLRKVIDPDFQRNIVELGFVKNLSIDGSAVAFDIELTTPACPIKDRFKSEATKYVSEISGVEKVDVRLTSRPQQRVPKVENSGLADVGSIVAIASGKGGVGKSTVAAVVAKELAQRGYKVGLLDTDIFGPSMPALFDYHEVGLVGNGEDKILPVEIEGLKLMSFGFWMGENPAVMRGPMVSNYVQQFLHQVAWGELDYLFLDLPPGTGDIQITISQSVQLDGAVIVTTPHTLSTPDVGKGMLMFDKVSVPVLGVIENMAYFQATPDSPKQYVFGRGGGERLATRFGVKVLAQIPIDPTEFGTPFNRQIDNEVVREAVDQVLRSLGTFSAGVKKPDVSHDERFITVQWPNGRMLKVANKDLRINCQCANCVDEMSGERTLDPDSVPDDIHAEDAGVIGNYAISVIWSDGHKTGFYPYDLIERLAVDQRDPETAATAD
jgi:Mrp family chromosome partitioning ATPase/DUF971 family protein